MRSGKLRHRITIQTATVAQDSYGQPVETWADTATVWGSVEPLSGSEKYRAQAERAELSHLVMIRYRSTSPLQRVVFCSRVFDVVNVINPEERNRELHLLCTEQVTA